MFNFAILRTKTLKEPKSLTLSNLIDGFLYRYKIYQIAVFTVLANSAFYLINRNKSQSKTSIAYESFYDLFQRASLTIDRETAYLMNHENIFQLADNLTNQTGQRVSKIRRASINLTNPASSLIPSNILIEINKFKKYMSIKKNTIANIYYTDKQGLLFIDPKDGVGAIKYKGRIYDVNGKRLDVMHKLLAPMSIVTGSTRISSGYGYRIHPILKQRLFHTGIDIRAPLKSKIHSALNGSICKIGYNNGYGNFIIIQHANNIQTLYAHLYSIHSSIRIGKKVRQGDVIGLVGKTGRATGPHVHFETRVNNHHVNPSTIEPIYDYANRLEMREIRSKVKELREVLHSN